MAETTTVADGVHRVADGFVNFYLLEEGGELTLVDAGWPRSWPVVEAAVTGLGRSLADVRAVVLTHAHPDHLGCAEEVRRRLGVPIYAARAEAARAKGRATGSSPFTLVPGLLPMLRYPSTVGFLGHASARGFMFPTWARQVTTFGDEDTLDVPGRPKAFPTPGHTEGHVSFLLPSAGVVLAGDALCTLDPFTRGVGPRLLPRNVHVDVDQVAASLTVLEGVAADTLLPGHGEPWTQGVGAAVARAREAGAAS